MDGQQTVSPGAIVATYAAPARYHLFGTDGAALRARSAAR